MGLLVTGTLCLLAAVGCSVGGVPDKPSPTPLATVTPSDPTPPEPVAPVEPSDTPATPPDAPVTPAPVTPDPPIDHGNTADTATLIQPESPITGRLESADDVDYFKVEVSSSSLVVAAADYGKISDYLYPDYGNVVVQIEVSDYQSDNDDHFDAARVTLFSPPPPASPKTLYVKVTSAQGATRYDLAVWLADLAVPSHADGPFRIDLWFLSPEPTAAQKKIFEEAVQVWERVISAGVRDYFMSRSYWRCDDDDPSPFGRYVDDLLIYVRIESIDGRGGTVAQAGPCWVRGADGLPFVGSMIFDSADLARLQADGRLRSIVTHEAAHVLGFGVRWDNVLGADLLPLLREPSIVDDMQVPGRDTWFAGPDAIDAFDDVGGAAYAGNKVPVENDTDRFGAGGLDVHWRESVFRDELMTSLVGENFQPLSKVTVASFADLGYEVDYSHGEDYALPAAPSTLLSARMAALSVDRGTHAYLGDDVRSGPIGVADAPDDLEAVIDLLP